MNRCLVTFTVTLALFRLATGTAWGKLEDNEAQEHQMFSYGSKGVQFESEDGNNLLWFGVRLQSRYSNTASDDEVPGEPPERTSELSLNRGRFKLGGHLIRPAFTVHSEYDFKSGTLLDLRATYEFLPALSLRIGQWKSEFNRERIDSSGALQFVERSLVTPWFTIDRQKGIVASGRIGAGQAYDSSYWFGKLSGSGRGGAVDDGDGLWLGRYQWNFNRRVLAFSQSDIKRQEPAGSLAAAVVSGKSRYTRFSSEGGGQLPGYSEGTADQYGIDQLMIETAWQGNGLSWQQELHWKNIEDRSDGEEQRLLGGYAQVGYFFHEIWDVVPAPFEVAARFAEVVPNRSVTTASEQELTLAGNWFFDGHRNKLTADVSRLTDSTSGPEAVTNRFRLQWDISF